MFVDMIVDMSSNNRLMPIVTELFIGSRKLNISLFFIMQPYFVVSKNIILKMSTLLHHENCTQMRDLRNC